MIIKIYSYFLKEHKYLYNVEIFEYFRITDFEEI